MSMTFRPLGRTGLSVSTICLGTMTYGEQNTEADAFEQMDYALDQGVNFFDTAELYAIPPKAETQGRTETYIGNWFKAHGNRNKIILASKVAGRDRGGMKWLRKDGSSPEVTKAQMIEALEGSLRRLQTDYIDLYYAHQDDPDTSIEESLQAFDSLVRSGKVRYIASSNFSADRMQESLRISNEAGFASYIAVQEHYNLIERESYESGMRKVVAAEGLSILPYFGLARGFLTGKYRPGTVIDSVRSGGVAAYQNDEGWKLLSKLDSLANHHKTTVSAIALAWLRSQPTVAAPIASARNINQLKEIMPLIELSADELQLLTNS